MGKKVKIGKRRKDKFYHLAKETGYRARSAFKLIQLNRKYQFLQQSRVLIDLCAAPGGWLQVAVKHMPLSSIVIGVDLVPIKSIPNVITIQEDITQISRLKQKLQGELKTWKADCILNDGAPNVGSSWVQDAYSQAELSLSALKLACEFLRRGGWFITKLFRSKDYQPLMWVLGQLFKKVHATKPQASRTESAEIFIVCQGFLAPDQIDPKLLDSKHVFKDIEVPESEQPKKSLSKILDPPKLAEGYPDGVHNLFKVVSVSNFVMSDDYLSVLSTAAKLDFDKESDVFARHPLTTEELKEYFQDIKVLGPREIKMVAKWREKMRKFLDEVGSDGEEEKMEEDSEAKEQAAIDAKIESLVKGEASEVKRLRRKLREQKRKLQERLVKKGESFKESDELMCQERMFSLKDIKTQTQLEKVDEGEMLSDAEKDGDDSEIDKDTNGKDNKESDMEGGDDEGDDDDDGEGDDDEGGDEDLPESEGLEDTEDGMPALSKETANPLIVSLNNESSATAKARLSDQWFSKDAFKALDLEKDEDDELKQMVTSHKKRGGQLWSRGKDTADGEEETGGGGQDKLSIVVPADTDTPPAGLPSKAKPASEGDDFVSDEGDGSSDDSELELKDASKNSSGDAHAKKRKLTPEGLAIGALVSQSKKRKEDLVEGGFNRWTHNDPENLPDWFAEDEQKHCQKLVPITKEMADEYRARLKEINARPIKKVAEAKCRKKYRVMKKMEKARKKIENIADDGDVTDREKARQIRQAYKKAGVLGKKKKEVEYVVAKKGMGKRVRRPAGVKGPFKVVDPRMKKDRRLNKDTKRRQQSQKKKR